MVKVGLPSGVWVVADGGRVSRAGNNLVVFHAHERAVEEDAKLRGTLEYQGLRWSRRFRNFVALGN